MKSIFAYSREKLDTTGDIDLEMDDENYIKVLESDIGTTVQVEATVVRGYTGNVGQVFIKQSYEQLTVDGVSLDEVEIIQVHGKNMSPITPSGDLYPEQVRITLKGVKTRI